MVQCNTEVCDARSHAWGVCSCAHVICELQLLCGVHNNRTEWTNSGRGGASFCIHHTGVDEATKEVLQNIFYRPPLSEFRLPFFPVIIASILTVTQSITRIPQTLHTLCFFGLVLYAQLSGGTRLLFSSHKRVFNLGVSAARCSCS